VNLAYDHYPELNAPVDRLRPDQADEARRSLLRLVEDDAPPVRLWMLPLFDGPADLSEQMDTHLFSGAPGSAGSPPDSPAIMTRTSVSR
jgi:hypothetical protein